MFKFRNIDGFVPGRFERMGMLKGKRWYTNIEDSEEFSKNSSVLFKPKRKEFGDKKVFCANHYGELLGYLLAIGSRTPSCKVELANLSRYYENIHKERNNGTPEPKDGCIIYSYLERNQMLEHGKIVVDNYVRENHNTSYYYKRDYENNIDVCIASIEHEIRNFYEKSKFARSQEYIDNKVVENRRKALNMIVYDCLYGNNDRHDENWALVKDVEGRDIELYPLYDNERVLGLFENIRVIESSLEKDTVEEDSEKILFSRMIVSNQNGFTASYKEVLEHLLSKYPETQEIVKQHLKGNPPIKVRMYLESCEGLPRSYITYGSKMYESRYNFTKNLLQQKGITSSDKTEESLDSKPEINTIESR